MPDSFCHAFKLQDIVALHAENAMAAKFNLAAIPVDRLMMFWESSDVQGVIKAYDRKFST